MEACVQSSIQIGGNNPHSIITGPNKGGKSSTLRALCLNVWLAQTFGLVFANSAKITPFSWIRSGLRLADLPGEESFFEREIKFAKQTLSAAATKKPGIVFYDECFHSTNPPDGEKTAKIFLSNLWANPNTISLVSTHVFSLVEEAPKNIHKMCVPAEKVGNQLRYSYRLTPGICKVSSVEEIYKKFGFPTAVKRPSESRQS
jgi:DNA mismatch repair ATPase MutS